MSTSISNMWIEEVAVKRPTSARRCLFGKLTQTDREIMTDVLKKQDQIDSDRFLHRWGFDPMKGVPVDGADCVCSPVDLKTESIPEFYTKGYAPRKSKPVDVMRTHESWRGPYNAFVFADAPQQVHSRRSVKRRLQFNDCDQENKRMLVDINPLREPSTQPREEDPSPAIVSTTSLALTVPSRSCPSTNKSESSSFSSTSLSSLKRSFSSVVKSSRKAVSSSISKRYRNSPSSFLDLATPRSIEAQHRTPAGQTLINEFFPVQKSKRSSSHFEI